MKKCHFADCVVGGCYEYTGLVIQNKVKDVQDLRFSQRCWRLHFVGYDSLSACKLLPKIWRCLLPPYSGSCLLDPDDGGRNQTQHTEAPSSETSVVYQSTWHNIEDESSR